MEWWGAIARQFEKVMYTLLYPKWVTNKDLLYSTWNSAQCYVAAWMESFFLKEWRYIYHGFTLLYSRKQHNIVNRLYSSKKFFRSLS